MDQEAGGRAAGDLLALQHAALQHARRDAVDPPKHKCGHQPPANRQQLRARSTNTLSGRQSIRQHHPSRRRPRAALETNLDEAESQPASEKVRNRQTRVGRTTSMAYYSQTTSTGEGLIKDSGRLLAGVRVDEGRTWPARTRTNRLSKASNLAGQTNTYPQMALEATRAAEHFAISNDRLPGSLAPAHRYCPGSDGSSRRRYVIDRGCASA